MKPVLDPLQQELALAVTRVIGDGENVRAGLAELDAFRIETPVSHGGLGLGLRYAAVVGEALGDAAAPDVYGAASLALELLPDGDALAGRIADGEVSVLELGVQPTADDGETVRITAASDGRPDVLELSGAEAFLELRDPSGAPTPALTRIRVRQAAYLLGLAAGAHAAAVRRVGERRQFGVAIGSFQAVRFELAADAARLEAVRLLTHRAAYLCDTAVARDAACALAALDALASAAELAIDVTRHAVHLHGSHGMTAASPTARRYLVAAVESSRWGSAAMLWREAGIRRLDQAAKHTDD